MKRLALLMIVGSCFSLNASEQRGPKELMDDFHKQIVAATARQDLSELEAIRNRLHAIPNYELTLLGGQNKDAEVARRGGYLGSIDQRIQSIEINQAQVAGDLVTLHRIRKKYVAKSSDNQMDKMDKIFRQRLEAIWPQYVVAMDSRQVFVADIVAQAADAETAQDVSKLEEMLANAEKIADRKERKKYQVLIKNVLDRVKALKEKLKAQEEGAKRAAQAQAARVMDTRPLLAVKQPAQKSSWWNSWAFKGLGIITTVACLFFAKKYMGRVSIGAR